MISKETVLSVLSQIKHPRQSADIVAAGAVENVQINGGNVVITLSINAQEADAMEEVRKRCETETAKIDGVTRVRAIMTSKRPVAKAPAHTPAPKPKPMKGVKFVIAVASGKGGVGKSTTSVNLAYALQKKGLKVGLADCDVYGPSASILLGVKTGPQFTDDDRILPVNSNGVLAISMSFLVDDGTAAIWRGPMVISAIQQFLNGVAWDIDGPLDVLICDLPPGTGDVQLTLAQTVNVAGAILVSTPQDLALIDALKAYDMFQKTNTPILGLIENMSQFVCPHCGESSDIFGHGGAKETARQIGIPYLGSIPLHMRIRESADAGAPIVLSAPESEQAAAYTAIAERVLASLTQR